MTNIRRRIHSLHPGQAVIVAAVIAAAGGGLFSMRQAIERRRAIAEMTLSRAQAELDSLYGQAIICADTTVKLASEMARATNRAMLEGRVPSTGGIIEPLDAGCSAVPERTREKKGFKADAEDARDRLGGQVVALGVLGALCIAVALSFLWVWFEGRRAT